MKYFKIIAVAILAVVIPFAIMRVGVELDFLSDIIDDILFSFPLYLPCVFIWFGIKILKATDKIFPPILFLNILLVLVISLLTQIIFEATERSLADSAIGLLLMGPLIYSIPASFIAAAIYKHKNTKEKSQDVENEPQE